MRKLIALTAAFALTGSVALAELSLSGTAELGLDYNSDPGPGISKHSFVHEVGIKFSGSGTTDGGLSFGGEVGFESNDTDVNTGKVFVSGAFGTLSIGDVARGSDLAGGIADVGMNGIGVDDMVEDLRETNAKSLRYENSFGQISIAFSAGTVDGKEITPAVEAVAGVAAKPGVFGWTNPGGSQTFGPLFVAQSAKDGTVALGDDAAAYQAAVIGAIKLPTGGTLAVTGGGINFDADGDSNTTNDQVNFVDVVVCTDDENKFCRSDGTTDLTDDEQAVFDALRAAYADAADANDNNIYLTASGTSISNTATPGSITVRAPVAAVAAVEAADAVFSSADTQYSFGMSFTASGVTVGMGYDSEKTVSMGMGFTQGDISTNALYVKQDGGDTGLGADVSYTMGASTITLAYAQGESSGVKRDAMGVNFSHDLGGGANLVAGFGQVEGADGTDANKASMGLTFAF